MAFAHGCQDVLTDAVFAGVVQNFFRSLGQQPVAVLVLLVPHFVIQIQIDLRFVHKVTSIIAPCPFSWTYQRPAAFAG